MTTTMLYRSGDAIALALNPDKKAGTVCRDQQTGEQHIRVWRDQHPAPEILRLDDVVPWTGDEETNEPF